MKPVKIPGNAAGKTTLLIVCHLLAPRPYDAASLTELGTALIASQQR